MIGKRSEGHFHGTSPGDLGPGHNKCVGPFPLRQSILPSVLGTMGEQARKACIWSVDTT